MPPPLCSWCMSVASPLTAAVQCQLMKLHMPNPKCYMPLGCAHQLHAVPVCPWQQQARRLVRCGCQPCRRHSGHCGLIPGWLQTLVLWTHPCLASCMRVCVACGGVGPALHHAWVQRMNYLHAGLGCSDQHACPLAQGLEKPIIVLSTAVTRAGAFVADPHRLNVALTRARNHLILVRCSCGTALLRCHGQRPLHDACCMHEVAHVAPRTGRTMMHAPPAGGSWGLFWPRWRPPSGRC